MEITPVLDSAYLSRLGFTENTEGEICWWKDIPQGRIFVDQKNGRGRLKLGPDEILNLHFKTVTQLNWFLDSLI